MILFQTIGDILLDEVFPSFKFEEFYTVNVEDIMKRFKHGIEGNTILIGECFTQPKMMIQCSPHITWI